MRRTLFCLLILLTALRGMVGDAMAMEMARMQSPPSAVMLHEMQTPAQAAATPPCHDAAPSTPDDAAQSSSECTACQVCHSPALQRLAALPELSKPVASFAARVASKWMSADLIQLQKPPLS
jgi:cytochrome c553